LSTLDVGERFELADEHEVKKLLGGPVDGLCGGHDRRLLGLQFGLRLERLIYSLA
jgi:hypothetical protein